MCVAELNLSILPCRHRWYRLLRSCSPQHDLSNCPNRLVLDGWEVKREFCPWCPNPDADENAPTHFPDRATYRLIGNDVSPSTTGFGYTPPMTRRGSLASMRHVSQGGSGSGGNNSRTGSVDDGSGLTPTQQRQIARSREQNQKIEAIIHGLRAAAKDDNDDEGQIAVGGAGGEPSSARSKRLSRSSVKSGAAEETTGQSGEEETSSRRRKSLGQKFTFALTKIGTFGRFEGSFKALESERLY